MRETSKDRLHLPFVTLVVLGFGCGGTELGPSGTTSSSSGGGSSSGTTASSGTSTNTPTVCTSNQTWTRGNRGSSSMHPGGTCISCHEETGGPLLTIAGTVYPTAHEPDDCDGVSTSVQVVITDAAGRTLRLTTNSAGNFYTSSSITFPFNAKVVSGTKERAMTAAQSSGDCNSCHTVDGTNLVDKANPAPGRIMAP